MSFLKKAWKGSVKYLLASFTDAYIKDSYISYSYWIFIILISIIKINEFTNFVLVYGISKKVFYYMNIWFFYRPFDVNILMINVFWFSLMSNILCIVIKLFYQLDIAWSL